MTAAVEEDFRDEMRRDERVETVVRGCRDGMANQRKIAVQDVLVGQTAKE